MICNNCKHYIAQEAQVDTPEEIYCNQGYYDDTNPEEAPLGKCEGFKTAVRIIE